MAFGPGHIDGSAEPNRAGNCALGGHRDSWFAFLREVRRGDEILLRTREGLVRYRVSQLAVRSMWDAEPLEPTTHRRLTLITCYPFDELRPSGWRYVVTCEAA
jgi:sortase A